MRRVLFRVAGIAFHAYPTMLYLGLVAGVVAGHYLAGSSGLDATRVTAATIVLVAPALFGSRLLFVALNWTEYRREPARIWRRSEGGAALYGGLLLSLVLSVPLLAWLRVSPGAFWDVAAVTMLVGMIPTRIGCVLNGCCGGRPSNGPLALYLPDERGIWRRRIPVQGLEAAWAAVLLAATAALWTRRPFEGAAFLSVLAAYGTGRSVLESLRETPDRIGTISVHQAISIALAVVSLTGLIVLGSA